MRAEVAHCIEAVVDIEDADRAKADLDNIFARLLSLGLEGAGLYTSGNTKGVLQKDLAGALTEELKCRGKFGMIFSK